MRKKTIIGLAIATILIAYISALTSSNQVFAQKSGTTASGNSAHAEGLGTVAAGGGLGIEQYVYNNLISSGLHASGGSASTTGQGYEAQLGGVVPDRTAVGTAPDTGQLGKILGSHPGLGCSPLGPRGC